MKKLGVMSLILVAFLGCGGGGGSSAPELAEATAANGLRAYDVMSISTYLPSVMTALYENLEHNKDQNLVCNGGGSFTITIDPNTEYGSPIETFSFKKCILNLNATNVYINGSVYITDRTQQTFGGAIDAVNDYLFLMGGIKSGLNFKMAGGGADIDLNYIANTILPASRGDNKIFGIASDNLFNVAKHLKNGNPLTMIYYINTAFDDKNYDKVSFIGNLTLEASTVKFKNTTLEVSEGTFMIAIDSKSYFTSDQLSSYSNKMTLTGADNLSLQLWQDATEAVYVDDGSGQQISYTSYTPSFW